jgi:hypothetical protein
MTEQLTQIEQELQTIETGLYKASIEYRELARDAAAKRAAYDVRWAQELLKVQTNKDAKLTVGEKEAMVTAIVQIDLTHCRIAEALADGSKRHLQTLQSILSSIQTRASLLKTERSLSAFST